MKKQIATTAAPAAIYPYSQAIDLGNMVFISGQIPVNPATDEIPEGIKAQTAQSIANIKAILAEARSDYRQCGQDYSISGRHG